jgi:serine/threonine protein phosphatase PrpC
LLSEREISGSSALLAVVCDGVGSMRDGAFAASFAVKMMNEWFNRVSDTERIGLYMRDEASKLNNAIIEMATERSLQTAATFTAMLFANGKYYMVHIGDTRVYSFDSSGIVAQLTVDDVSAKGRLTGCIGRFENPVFLCSEGKTSGKAFLICSDGLYKRLDVAPALAAANVKHRKDVKKIVGKLAEYAIERGERDNISLALVIPKMEASA